MSDHRFTRLIAWATTQTDVITIDEISRQDDVDDRHDTSRRLATTLFYLVTTALEGSSSLRLDGTDDNNGFEAWRKLEARYGKTMIHNALLGPATIVNVKFNSDNEFETKFAKWELDIAKFEKATGTIGNDQGRSGTLCDNWQIP